MFFHINQGQIGVWQFNDQVHAVKLITTKTGTRLFATASTPILVDLATALTKVNELLGHRRDHWIFAIPHDVTLQKRVTLTAGIDGNTLAAYIADQAISLFNLPKESIYFDFHLERREANQDTWLIMAAKLNAIHPIMLLAKKLRIHLRAVDIDCLALPRVFSLLPNHFNQNTKAIIWPMPAAWQFSVFDAKSLIYTHRILLAPKMKTNNLDNLTHALKQLLPLIHQFFPNFFSQPIYFINDNLIDENLLREIAHHMGISIAFPELITDQLESTEPLHMKFLISVALSLWKPNQ